LRGFSSLIGIDYKVKGLESQTHKKFANRTMQEQTSKEDFYFEEPL
jgi:hypothetical protein